MDIPKNCITLLSDNKQKGLLANILSCNSVMTFRGDVDDAGVRFATSRFGKDTNMPKTRNCAVADDTTSRDERQPSWSCSVRKRGDSANPPRPVPDRAKPNASARRFSKWWVMMQIVQMPTKPIPNPATDGVKVTFGAFSSQCHILRRVVVSTWEEE